MKEEYLTKNELAKAFGVSLVTISSWLAKGLPYREKGRKGKGYKFYLPEVEEWVKQMEKEKLSELNLEILKAKAKYREEKAKLIELERKEKERFLIKREKVEKVLIEIANSFKKKLYLWKTKLPPKLENRTRKQIEVILDEEIEEFFEDINKKGMPFNTAK